MSLRDSELRAAPIPASAGMARAASRQRWGAVNRRLGWVILPMVIAASVVHFGPWDYTSGHLMFVIGLQLIYVPLVALHAWLSFYVFGWVPPRRTLRVFHVWFGYAYAISVLTSQTTFGLPKIHRVLTIIMFSSLALHVGIGIYYARRRRRVVLGRIPQQRKG